MPTMFKRRLSLSNVPVATQNPIQPETTPKLANRIIIHGHGWDGPIGACLAVDWLMFVWLHRLCPGVVNAIAIIRPETLIRWNRNGLRAF